MPTGSSRPSRDMERSSHERTAGEGRQRGAKHGWADPRRALGWRGEDHAIAHFRTLGFEVVAHNQHRRFGEIDLVVFDGRTLVFVEVKTRHIARSSADNPSYDGQTLGWPSIKQYKAHRRIVRAWLAEHRSRTPRARALRLDVVKVLFDEHDEFIRVDHIEAAWEGVW